jgi:mono/diheme cytochrome c family protein
VLASVHPAGANEEIPFTPEQLAAAQTNYVDFCSDCHATNGSGAIGPGIRGSGALADAQYVLRQIAQGSGEMPGFGSVLSDEEILGLANYVRNNLGNSFGYITVEEAASAAQ